MWLWLAVCPRLGFHQADRCKKQEAHKHPAARDRTVHKRWRRYLTTWFLPQTPISRQKKFLYLGGDKEIEKNERTYEQTNRRTHEQIPRHRQFIPPPGQSSRNHVSIINDPTAGSPTVTLLRLLLPLNDQVCPTSRKAGAVAGTIVPIRRAH